MSAGQITQGHRVDALKKDGHEPGDYWFMDGKWWCWPPGTNFVGNLDSHIVTEHEDHTITASPSILVDASVAPKGPFWHGYLERGVWREA